MELIYGECIYEKTLNHIVDIYNSNMGDTIPKEEHNKKYKFIKYLFDAYGFDFIDEMKRYTNKPDYKCLY